MPTIAAPASPTKLPDAAFIAVLRAFRAWATFETGGHDTTRGICYDAPRIKSSIPESNPPLPERLADFALAWGCLARRDRDVLWAYYIDEAPGGDGGIAGKYAVRRATVWEWRHAALWALAEKLGVLAD